MAKMDEAKKWIFSNFVDHCANSDPEECDYFLDLIKSGSDKRDTVYTLDLDDFVAEEVRKSMEFVDLLINEGLIDEDKRQDVELFLEGQQLKIVACGDNENKKHKH